MTKDEALKLALEALKECRRDPRLKYEHPFYDKTITAIREALAEQPAQKRPQNCGTGYCSCIECLFEQPAQQQEPWGYLDERDCPIKFKDAKHRQEKENVIQYGGLQLLYTTNPTHPQTEPAFWTRKQFGEDREFCEKPFTTDWEPLYKAPHPAQDQGQSCPNCESLSKQVTALKTCLEVERGFREQEQPAPVAKPHKQQEPVAWVYPEFWEHLERVGCGTAYAMDADGKYPDDVKRTPLYRNPLPDREPYAWVTFTPYGEEDDVWYENPEGQLLEGWTYKPLYDTSPQPSKPWVGLTNKDIYECEPKTDWYDSVEFAKAIEAKLREKNA